MPKANNYLLHPPHIRYYFCQRLSLKRTNKYSINIKTSILLNFNMPGINFKLRRSKLVKLFSPARSPSQKRKLSPLADTASKKQWNLTHFQPKSLKLACELLLKRELIRHDIEKNLSSDELEIFEDFDNLNLYRKLFPSKTQKRPITLQLRQTG